MKYNNSYCRGYKDYVNGFEKSQGITDPYYSEGYEEARNHFMNDIPYNYDIVEDMW